MAILNKSGKIKMLRVSDLGDSYGRPPDNILAEVIVQLEDDPGEVASGFQLHDNEFLPARQGMLDLLRDAFANGWRVHYDHELGNDQTHGTIFRVWVTKDPNTGGGGGAGGQSVLTGFTPR